MKELKKKILYVLLIFFVGFGVITNSFSQTSKEEKKLLSLQINGSKIKGRSVYSVLAEIVSDYKVPIGLESELELLNDKTSKSVENDEQKIPLPDGSLEQVLNQLVTAKPNYDWSLNNGVINVFPKQNRDYILKDLLETRIKKLSLSIMTGVMGVGDEISDSPEIQEKLTTYGLTSLHYYQNNDLNEKGGIKSAINFNDASVREILNEVIKKDKLRIWTVTRWGPDNKLFTITVR